MVTSIKAIPTLYANTLFRSRLEARWAAMFDACEWKWDYEPEDFDGYVPDFKLQLRTPIFVEVKPLRWDESESDEKILNDARVKIARSGLKGEVLALGFRIVTLSASGNRLAHQTLGAIMDIDPDTDEASPWCPAFAFRCDHCGRRSFANEMQSWHCRVRGCYDGRDHLNDWDADLDFRRAGSEVQWKPSQVNR